MGQPVELLRIAARRVASEREFMSFALHQYMAIERMTESDLMTALDCSPENFYRLALCRMPDRAGKDFMERLERIAAYTQTIKEELKGIIERLGDSSLS